MIIGMGQYMHKDYARLQDQAVTDGVTRPSYEQRVKENAWMRNMDSKDGAWATTSRHYNFRSDAVEDYGYYNWKDPTTDKIVKSGTVTWTSMDGSQGNGSSGRYNTSFQANDGGGWALSNCSIRYDLLTTASGVHLGSNQAVGSGYNLISGVAQVTRLNSTNSATALTPANPGAGHWVMQKPSALVDDAYKNGSLDATTATTQEGSLASSAMQIFCRLNSGSPSDYSACKIGYVAFGAAIADNAAYNNSLTIFKS